MLRARDWENLLWNVRRGRSVLFLGPEPGGTCEAAKTGLQVSLLAAPLPLSATTFFAILPKGLRVGLSHFRGPHLPLIISRSLRTPMTAPPGLAEPVLGAVGVGKTSHLALRRLLEAAR